MGHGKKELAWGTLEMASNRAKKPAIASDDKPKPDQQISSVRGR